MFKRISLLIAFGELILIDRLTSTEIAARWLIFMIPPLAYIWFSDEVGMVHRGQMLPFYSSILRPSPSWLIRIIALIVLLLPLIILLGIPYVILPLFAPDVKKLWD